jgi:hypothetical protein
MALIVRAYASLMPGDCERSRIPTAWSPRRQPPFRKEAPIMTTVNTAFSGEQPSMNRVSRFSRKMDASTGGRTRVSGLRRRLGALMLRAGLSLLALATIFALQAAFYVYVWRLPR